jgi:hypothetical protein
VRGSRINKIAEPELANSPQPLKRCRPDDAPDHALETVAFVEFDDVVERVAHPLSLGLRHSAIIPDLTEIGGKPIFLS